MTAENLWEARALEQWIVANPDVLDNTLKIVTTQFNSWASEQGVARERPDILALSTTGQLVVIELKREKDRHIHLQGITYAALAAGFSRESLADAHARWLQTTGQPEVTREEAMTRLQSHVESDWTDDLLQLPRILLVAEHFPAQVLTTVQWLADTAAAIEIECHEYQLFQHATGLLASFQRLFPVDDLENRRLRPAMSSVAAAVSEKLTTNTKRAKSVTIIFDNELIADGARLTLELNGLVKSDTADAVSSWLAVDARRSEVTWTRDSIRPLRWALDRDRQWTPSALRDEIFARAGSTRPSFSAADAWCYNGRSLYWIANELDVTPSEALPSA